VAAERVVIVGAGPAGLATARAYRRHGGRGEVTLLGEEPLAPYRRPPLTKDFLRGELDAEDLQIEPASWFEQHRVELRLDTRVHAVDPAAGTVSAGAATLEADAIVLATGAEPLRAGLPGSGHDAVMTIRTLADSAHLARQAHAGTSLLVIGTGFVGCEVAASLAMRGATVTLIGQEPMPQAERLGDDAGARVAAWLEQHGVRLVMGADVSAIHDGRIVELADGPRLAATGVVLALGVRPRTELAEAAGLALREGAISTDARMHTAGSGAAVLAVGDAACAENASAARHLRVEHWGAALEQGEVAGQVLAGGEARWESVPGFWSTIGSRTIKYAGWGDGHDHARLVEHGDGAFTVWYSREDVAVGVLAHERDCDYERGRELIQARLAAP
jgi:3-phenylpropionate/trans-cinnamate dioxygenase ferredoxin reductase subunit